MEGPVDDFIAEHHKELLTIQEYLAKRKGLLRTNSSDKNINGYKKNKTSSPSERVELVNES